MRKVAIVTCYKHKNFGSALQAYALQKSVESLGYCCDILKYPRKAPFARLATLLRHPIKAVNRHRAAVAYKLEKVARQTPCRFDAFVREYISEDGTVHTSATLKETNRQYDAFICGSDQIWAPSVFNEWYYLDFVEEDGRKIAYAPSIGLPEIPKHLQSKMAGLISAIKYESVREEQGADLIWQMTGRRVPVVLDPTLLIPGERWKEIAKDAQVPDLPKGGYILCYFLRHNPEYREAAEEYGRRTGKIVVGLSCPACRCTWGDVIVEDAGPLEFIRLVSNADVVLTDSFHGILFSINLNRNFYAFKRFADDDRQCQNSRVVNIASMMGLGARIIDRKSLQEKNDEHIDFGPVNRLLDKERQKSLEFLRHALLGSAGPEGMKGDGQ